MSEVQKQKRRFQFVNKFKIKFVIISNIIMHLALLVASGVITILLTVKTVPVKLMYPMFLFCTKHNLPFQQKPSDRNR